MPTTPEFPKHIDIDLSSKCNLRCRFCHLVHFTPESSPQITLEEFKTFEPILSHLKSITLFSKFEPLTCREFTDIFNYISSFGIETYFSSNGLLLDDEIIETIVGRLTYLTISITGFTPETYKFNMGQDGFDKVINNITKLNQRKAALGTNLPQLRISTVGMTTTVDDLPKAIKLAKDLNASEGLQVTYLKAHGEEMLGEMPLQQIEDYSIKSRAAVEYARELGIKIDFQGGLIPENQVATKQLGHKYCTLPWERMSIQPTGKVYPCPMAQQSIGNFREKSLKEIFTSAEMEAFRAGVNDPAHMNPDCQNCSHCRHRSVLDQSANDFSKAETYVAGMTRRTTVSR